MNSIRFARRSRILAALAGLALASSAPAQNIVVNSTLDNLIAFDGFITLREAIIAANADPDINVIEFHPSTNGIPIVLTLTGANEDNCLTGDLDITQPVVIRGNGIGVTIISGGGSATVITDRVFHTQATSGNTVRFENLTVTGGSLPASPVASGAGIFGAVGGTVHLDRVELRHNFHRSSSANQGGGGIGTNSAVPVIIENSYVLGNFALAVNAFGGGASFRGGDITIRNSVFAGNVVGAGSGSSQAGTAIRADIATGDGTFILENSVIAGNNLNSGVTSSLSPTNGGAVNLIYGTAYIRNNVFVGNRSNLAGLHVQKPASLSSASVSVIHNTFSSNISLTATGPGGGIAIYGPMGPTYQAPEILGNIFDRNDGSAIREGAQGPSGNPNPASVRHNLFANDFPNGRLYADLTAYTPTWTFVDNGQVATLNGFSGGYGGNLEGPAAYVQDGPQAVTGTWGTGATYTAATNTSVITANGTPFAGMNLYGRIINTDVTQKLHHVIIANTNNQITVVGDITAIAANTETFRLADFRLRNTTSAAIDRIDGATLPLPPPPGGWGFDFEADARGYDVPGAGNDSPSPQLFDIGADEAVPPTILTTSAGGTICVGDNVSATVTNRGTGPFTYAWFKDGTPLSNGGNISGANTATLNINPVAPGDDGTYTCQVTNAFGTVTSANVVWTLGSGGGSITDQPDPVTQCAGTTANFSVAVTGFTGETYSWRLNGVPLTNGGDISGADTPNLSIANIDNADVGDYTCAISTPCGGVISDPAALTLNQAATVTDDPDPVAACPGTTANFSVTAGGTGPFTYQWRLDGTPLSNGGDISGADTAMLSIANVDAADIGNYDVVVTGVCAPPAISAAAALTLNAPPTVTDDPDAVVQCPGTTANFTVAATGTGPLTFQWRKDSTPLSNGGDISGADTPTLSIANLDSGDLGTYDVVITGACAPPVTSAGATLTLNDPPAITDDPDAVLQCPGTTATFTVAATGTGPLTFQWRKDSTPLTNGGDISGADTPTLSIANIDSADVGGYTVLVSGACSPAVTSTTATLALEAVPSIIQNPADEAVCAGSTAFFTVTATGSGPLTYQWYFNGTPLANGGDISGADTATLAIANAEAADAGNYTVEVSGLCTPPATSNVSTLTVNPVTVITDQPDPYTGVVDDDFTLSVVATVTGTPSYQWFKNGSPVVDGGSVTGQGTATLTFTDATTGDSGDYWVVVTGDCGDEVSATVTVTITTGVQDWKD